MALHRLTSVTIGVPNAAETVAYYADFGLADLGDGTFATIDGGRQLTISRAPTRRLVDLTVGADDADDTGRIAAGLEGLGLAVTREGDTVSAREPVTGLLATVEVSPRLEQPSCRRPRTTARGGPSAITTGRRACCATTRCGR